MKRIREPASNVDVTESPTKRGTQRQQQTLNFNNPVSVSAPHHKQAPATTATPATPAPRPPTYIVPLPSTKDWKVINFFKSYKVSDLPKLHTADILTVTTGVYHLIQKGTELLVPKKKAHTKQIKLWDDQLKALNEQKKQEEERKKLDYEAQNKQKYDSFLQKSKSYSRQDSDEDDEEWLQEGVKSVNNTLPDSDSNFAEDDDQEWDDSLEQELYNDQLENDFDSDGFSEIETVPRFSPGTGSGSVVGIGSAVVGIGSGSGSGSGSVGTNVINVDDDEENKIASIERKLMLLESMTMPILLFNYRMYNNIHLVQPESFLTANLVPEFSTYELYETFYRSLYEGNNKTGGKFWKITSVKEDSGAKGGENNPTIQMSGVCKLNEMMVPDNFHLESKNHPFFVTWSRWFVQYHKVYCMDVYGTCTWEDVVSCSDFIELATGVFQSRRQNKNRTVDNKVETAKQNKIAAFKEANGIVAKGATSDVKKQKKKK